MHLSHPRILHAKRDMFLAQFGGRIEYDEVGVVVEVDIHAQIVRYKSRKNVTTIIIILFHLTWNVQWAL